MKLRSILLCFLTISSLSCQPSYSLTEVSSKLDDLLTSHREVLCMTLTVWGEVGEVKNNHNDIKAVANVIMNRVRSDNPYFPNTVCEVVLKRNQFEPLKHGSRLRYHTLQAIGNPHNFRIPQYINREMFWTIYNISLLAYHGHLRDNTNGAIGFYAPKAQKQLGRNKPAFAKKLQLVASVGEHQFYR